MDEDDDEAPDPLPFETWECYPWQHPVSYWLRANPGEMICTRCGDTLTPPMGPESAITEASMVFVEFHGRCDVDSKTGVVLKGGLR